MRQKRKLSGSRLNALDDRLFDYKDINRAIALRKLEIDTDREYETNIGGGKSNLIPKPTENLIIKWDEDVKLKNLYLFRKNVDDLIKRLTPEEKVIFQRRWIDQCYTWEEIADLIYVSRTGIFRQRLKILEKFADLMGEI